MSIISERIKQVMTERDLSYGQLSELTHIPKSSLQRYVTGSTPKIPIDVIQEIESALNLKKGTLLGWEPESDVKTTLPTPNITDDFVTMPVYGEIAAGYDSLAVEDWNGETVDIPTSYFKGRDKSEFLVLEVKGDSMYPEYQEGDRVLVLKQTTLEYSGQIGAVLYEDSHSTLKKVEYAQGQDWLKLVPINPSFKPQRIEGEKLEHCRILGIPRLLIRDVKN